MTTTLHNSPRVLIDALLVPIQGQRFQPTGFPDIGAAEFSVPDGRKMLLVESEQSMANRLEEVCWDRGDETLVPALRGMPYVQVNDAGGSFLTCSLLEAHRLNSVYIEKTAFTKDTLIPAIGYDKEKPVDLRALAGVLFKFDPSSLIHGTFLESIAGVLRLPRALSAFIEADTVNTVNFGGVKNDRVRADTQDSTLKAKDGYGNVPFHRTEYVAEEIRAYFKIDLGFLRSLGLGEEATAFLVDLAQWKIVAFLESGLRLRTACDFDVVDTVVRRPEGHDLPSKQALESSLQSRIERLRADGTFGASPTVTTYTGK